MYFVRKKSRGSMVWEKAPDLKKKIRKFALELELTWLKTSRLFVYRSFNSTSRAYARTWSFPRIWQLSLKEKPAYVLEFLAERFDRLSQTDQDKVILHELTHIPRNFSGALVAHTRRGNHSFHKKLDDLIRMYTRSRN